jgi:phosphopantothenoylcysteine decarboxylase/phosphopantothenate--cysteine ligase
LRILVGITGGIAAYKSATLVRGLTELGHDVKVLPTQNALRFIGSASLEALSHNAVDPDLYTQVQDVKHISLAQEADLIIVAPATAAFIARYAVGLADDLLLNVLLAATAKVVIAPAMHTEMWSHPATVKNIQILKDRGVFIIEPGIGRLTGSDSGAGRMAEPDDIIQTSLSISSRGLDMLGRKVVVAAGGTQEPIDDVRFIGNRSSGKQGLAIVKEAKARGAIVTLIAANLSSPVPEGIELIRVSTAAEAEEKLSQCLDADAIFMPIAVSDFRIDQVYQGKIHRKEDESFDLRLLPNPDILKRLVSKRGSSTKPLLIGFAAESVTDETELIQRAKAKKSSKGCDVLVANNVSEGAIFGSDDTEVQIIEDTKATKVSGTKTLVAQALIDLVAQRQ